MSATAFNPVKESHDRIAAVLRKGDCAIDATAGNGHDTAFLASIVGSTGRVFAFDIQESARDQTLTRLQNEKLSKQVTFFREDHRLLSQFIPSEYHGKVRAAMFNLGYLPGGNKSLVTQPAATLDALEQALDILATGGILTVVYYTGHPGGREEANAVLQWARQFEDDRARVEHIQPTRMENNPPGLLVLAKA